MLGREKECWTHLPREEIPPSPLIRSCARQVVAAALGVLGLGHHGMGFGQLRMSRLSIIEFELGWREVQTRRRREQGNGTFCGVIGGYIYYDIPPVVYSSSISFRMSVVLTTFSLFSNGLLLLHRQHGRKVMSHPWRHKPFPTARLESAKHARTRAQAKRKNFQKPVHGDASPDPTHRDTFSIAIPRYSSTRDASN